ncbi:KTSC domain-containing protein [Paenibacillus sp. SI8]|uniref:KTSC domain-containing protein n=1 Tax=unclassified Paenibacillus TaxID=185978 RepID=UPI003466D5D0
MNIIPIVSRQIAYVEYDHQSSSMIVQYHTGFKASYSNVKEADYQMIVTSTNRYDSLMRLTETRYAKERSPTW